MMIERVRACTARFLASTCVIFAVICIPAGSSEPVVHFEGSIGDIERSEHAMVHTRSIEIAGEIGPEPSSTVYENYFDVLKKDSRYSIEVKAVLEQGGATLEIIDPKGESVHTHQWGERFSEELEPLGPFENVGRFKIVVTPAQAVGFWRVHILELPGDLNLKISYWSVPPMLLLGLVPIAFWKWRSKAPWVWFIAGAPLMFVWFVLFVFVVLVLKTIGRPVLEGPVPYLYTAFIYAGFTGVAAGVSSWAVYGTTARLFTSLRRDKGSALAVAVGSAAFEPLLMAALTVGGLVTMFSGESTASHPQAEPSTVEVAAQADGANPGTRSPLRKEDARARKQAKRERAHFNQAHFISTTPWLTALADPSTHGVRMICRMAALGLIMLGVATRNRSRVFEGAAFMGACMAAMGTEKAISLFGLRSDWWMSAFGVPFALLGVLILWRAFRSWPVTAVDGEVPMEAFLRSAGDESPEA